MIEYIIYNNDVIYNIKYVYDIIYYIYVYKDIYYVYCAYMGMLNIKRFVKCLLSYCVFFT